MIKIAIIGCGRIFNKHYIAINNTTGIKLVAVCDIDKKKFKNIPNGISCYTNINQMLTEVNPDLISICTPSGLHVEHANIALKHKKNVLLEKPIDVNYLRSLNLVNKFKKSSKKLFLVKQNRYNKTIIFLKDVIRKNKLGKIKLVLCNVLWSRPETYYQESKWRGTKKLDGGVILNQSSHYIDLLMWLFGEIDKFKVIRKRLSRKIECEDTALVSIYFKKKILANLTMTTLVPFKNYEGSITVIGDKGLIKIGGQALNEIVETINIKLTKKHNYEIDDIYGHGHLKVYKEVVKNLTNKKNEAVFASEGLKSLKFINQLYSQSKI